MVAVPCCHRAASSGQRGSGLCSRPPCNPTHAATAPQEGVRPHAGNDAKAAVAPPAQTDVRRLRARYTTLSSRAPETGLASSPTASQVMQNGWLNFLYSGLGGLGRPGSCKEDGPMSKPVTYASFVAVATLLLGGCAVPSLRHPPRHHTGSKRQGGSGGPAA